MPGESGPGVGVGKYISGRWVWCWNSAAGSGGGKDSFSACWCLLSLTNVIYTLKASRLLFPSVAYKYFFTLCICVAISKENQSDEY